MGDSIVAGQRLAGWLEGQPRGSWLWMSPMPVPPPIRRALVSPVRPSPSPAPGRLTLGLVALEAVQLLRFPGRAVALVSREVAELGERMGELRRLDAEPDQDRQAIRGAARPAERMTGQPLG
jgi:hypothetical protein